MAVSNSKGIPEKGFPSTDLKSAGKKGKIVSVSVVYFICRRKNAQLIQISESRLNE